MLDLLKSILIILFIHAEYWSLLNFLVLTLTLIVLIWYAVDTHRIADQTIESNLRPVILRIGWITNWDDIHYKKEDGVLKGRPLEFLILKNLAKDISGYIIINKQKHILLFGNNISQISKEETEYCPTWGWLAPGGKIYAMFDDSKSTNIESENCIYITYKDISGNTYFTKENKNFSQNSDKF